MCRSWLLVSALVAVAGACSSGGEDGSAGRFGAVHQNVCAAAAAARADDHSSAQRRFSDAHSGLHDLADAVEEHDRRAAAALLEAKQRAEAALGEPSPPTRELTDLADAVGGAIAAIGAEPSPRCSP